MAVDNIKMFYMIYFIKMISKTFTINALIIRQQVWDFQ